MHPPPAVAERAKRNLPAQAELFHTPDREPYATVPVHGHAETWPIRSTEFRHLLERHHYLHNQWLVTFDNLSEIKPWLSDALCRLANGGGLRTRRLYTDEEEMIFEAMRPSLITSIEPVVTRGDLLDRSIIISLPTIPPRGRLTEQRLFHDFEQARPRILGALLDAMAKALGILPTLDGLALPRMGDFALWGSAVERALGWEDGSFMAAYHANQQAAHHQGL